MCYARLCLQHRVKYLSGNTEACQSGVQFCLKQDSTHSDAHLLLAELQLAQGNATAASASLELGLSSNFEVSESRLFTICLVCLLFVC